MEVYFVVLLVGLLTVKFRDIEAGLRAVSE
jgi:hypothetical protein